jgi:hypothetical protein
MPPALIPGTRRHQARFVHVGSHRTPPVRIPSVLEVEEVSLG